MGKYWIISLSIDFLNADETDASSADEHRF